MNKNFTDILNRVKKILNTDLDSDVASAINASVNAFSNRKRSGSIPYSEFVQLAEEKKVSLNWLFYGEGPIYNGEFPSSENIIKSDHDSSKSNITKVIIEHIDTIKRFKNPEKAKEINEALVEIEEISEDLFDSIASHIKSSLNAAKIVKGNLKKTPNDGEDIQDKSTA